MYLTPIKLFSLVLVSALILSLTAHADSVVTYPPAAHLHGEGEIYINPPHHTAPHLPHVNRGTDDFLTLDSNADGAVDKDEYLASTDPDLRTSHFEHFDADGDGELDEREFVRHQTLKDQPVSDY